MKLNGRVAVVTGGSTGIGKAIAKTYMEEGAICCICSPVPAEVEAAVAELNAYGTIRGFLCDVADRQQVKKMTDAIRAEFGHIDVLVNNAGITRDAQFYKMTDEQFDAVINVNLNGNYNMTKAVVNGMKEQGYGKIINVASVSAFNGNFGQSNYAASKAAVMGMTRVLGKELGKYGINVNAIAPGSIMTAMYEAVPEHLKEEKLKRIPLKRYGKPEDVAALALFLASDDASYITSQTIVIDGGSN